MKTKILSEKEYVSVFLKQLRGKKLVEFRNNYIKSYHNGKTTIKWKTFKEMTACASQFSEFLHNDENYQYYINNENILEDPEFQSCYHDYLEKEQNKESDLEKFINETFINGAGHKDYVRKLHKCIDKGLNDYFSRSMVMLFPNIDVMDIFMIENHGNFLSLDTGMYFCRNYDGYIKELILKSDLSKVCIWKAAYRYVTNRKIVKDNLELFKSTKIMKKVFESITDEKDKIIESMVKKYTLDYAITLMNENNPNYKGTLSKYIGFEETTRLINDCMLKAIPDNYVDLFPLARKMHRIFYLHIGGTNSGKTYSAIQALKKSGNGVYLGPLRLLAAEQFIKLNNDGYPCSLLTGEEKKITEGAEFISSTIEMLNFSKHYNTAVIDEAQMVSDSVRGGSWTNAILGVLADEVHVCVAPEAEDVIIKIIEACGDEYHIQYHERNTPLILEDDRFTFTKQGIHKSDAMIVFSKKRVHAVAHDLREIGIKPSIIYGALPYDVRQNEANKFANGITDVLVTTDAIGLGMNLPIKRVVFLETGKFDGTESRPLRTDEIKQIAGRAGRFGIFNEGYVNTFENKEDIALALSSKVPDIKEVYLRFPEFLISIDGPLSYILVQWENMKVNPGFKKADISHEKKLCKIAEELTDDKQLIYDFITIPFNDEDGDLLNLWKRMLRAKLNGEHICMHKESLAYQKGIENLKLQELEIAYKISDLLFYYNEKFEGSLESAFIMEEKEEISNAIINLLDSNKLPVRKCKVCGKPLAWHFKHDICERCHSIRRYY